MKQPTHSLRYTMPLEAYQGFSYSVDNYLGRETNPRADYGSYISPFEA